MWDARHVGFFLASVLGIPALAGCLGGEAPEPAPASPTPSPYFMGDDFPLDTDHDHADMTLHNASFNFEFVSYHSCTPEGTFQSGPLGQFTDIAFHHPYAFIGQAAGFCILDIADPAQPKFVSRYVGQRQNASDIDLSADGDYLLLPTQRNPLQIPNVADPTKSLPRGILVFNVKDRRNPVLDFFYPVPTNGVHTISTYLMEARQLVFIQTYDWIPPGELNETVKPPALNPTNPPGTPRVEIAELVVDAAGKAELRRISLFEVPRPPGDPLLQWFPHDAQAQKHPKTGQTLLYVAYWDAGLVLVDISEPARPAMMARYDNRSPSVYNHYHDARASEVLIDGRHVTVTAPEIYAGPETGVVRIFDTSDPRQPVQIGWWKLPGNLGIPRDFLYSPHVFSLDEGRIYLGHRHAGVWVLDISTADNLTWPKAVGYYFPHGDARLPSAAWSRSSNVWGAYFHEGLVYVTEENAGLHVLRFRGDA